MTTFSTLRRVCAAQPHAEPERKWGNVDTFLVRRRMFAILVLDARGRPNDLWFKVDAERFLELTDRPGIRPAPYLARAGWVAIGDPSRFALAELRPLIERSHRLVVAGLSMKVQRALGFDPQRRPPARAARIVTAARPADAGGGPRPAGLATTPRLLSSRG
ncbi:MAG: MmcQ/YjbR family DNA-binding protein [Burkholderiales bacterium]|nr:MAG: MmcQ/YjbR family DNA-binding protein [Burkholderiales bacterium]